jgi:hypothetical protein
MIVRAAPGGGHGEEAAWVFEAILWLLEQPLHLLRLQMMLAFALQCWRCWCFADSAPF